MNDIKTRYENEFLTSERGQKLAIDAKKMMDEECGKKDAYTFTTKGVRREYLPDVLHKAKLVNIAPIGLNNYCFQNATWLEAEFGFKKIYGFNISACPCGGRMTFEIHAVNRTASGELIDITRDYCGETAKWFVPFENEDYNQKINKALFGRDGICFEPNCRCARGNNRWNNTHFCWMETEGLFEDVWKVINNQGKQYWTKKMVE
jgi:hypothetical protein